MMLTDFYQYRAEVKRALLARKSQMEREWDPFIASWLAYAFVHEPNTQSLPLKEVC